MMTLNVEIFSPVLRILQVDVKTKKMNEIVSETGIDFRDVSFATHVFRTIGKSLRGYSSFHPFKEDKCFEQF